MQSNENIYFILLMIIIVLLICLSLLSIEPKPAINSFLIFIMPVFTVAIIGITIKIHCEECGKKSPIEVKFCKFCGAEFPAIDHPEFQKANFVAQQQGPPQGHVRRPRGPAPPEHRRATPADVRLRRHDRSA